MYPSPLRLSTALYGPQREDKNMATHKQVMLNWFDKTGKARQGFNVFYDDTVIYSYGYHFPMARHYEADGGTASAILVTTRSYSVSTSKHMSLLRGIMCYKTDGVFEVDNVMAWSKAAHKENYEKIVKGIPEILKRASRARKHKIWHIADAQSLVDTANRYTKFFKLGYKARELEDYENL